jgi:hypothetical protein
MMRPPLRLDSLLRVCGSFQKYKVGNFAIFIAMNVISCRQGMHVRVVLGQGMNFGAIGQGELK